MNKTAKEMFEELGYKEKPYREDLITYIQKIGIFPTARIDISIKGQYFEKTDDYDLSYIITYEELQAINKQIEELGWDKGENNE